MNLKLQVLTVLASLVVILSTSWVSEGACSKVRPADSLSLTTEVDADLSYCCACGDGILRSPTMWLGIFTGGYVHAHKPIFLFSRTSAFYAGHLLPSHRRSRRRYFKQDVASNKLEKVRNAIEVRHVKFFSPIKTLSRDHPLSEYCQRIERRTIR
jgi:hypothetical protein